MFIYLPFLCSCMKGKREWKQHLVKSLFSLSLPKHSNIYLPWETSYIAMYSESHAIEVLICSHKSWYLFPFPRRLSLNQSIQVYFCLFVCFHLTSYIVLLVIGKALSFSVIFISKMYLSLWYLMGVAQLVYSNLKLHLVA